MNSWRALDLPLHEPFPIRCRPIPARTILLVPIFGKNARPARISVSIPSHLGGRTCKPKFFGHHGFDRLPCHDWPAALRNRPDETPENLRSSAFPADSPFVFFFFSASCLGLLFLLIGRFGNADKTEGERKQAGQQDSHHQGNVCHVCPSGFQEGGPRQNGCRANPGTGWVKKKKIKSCSQDRESTPDGLTTWRGPFLKRCEKTFSIVSPRLRAAECFV